ncbi:MAG: hypothetical protein KJP15_06230, partial [Gammaproteobacteria bacterium]|nr:hypothetical protein [Gammaproteobacteria bacterium]
MFKNIYKALFVIVTLLAFSTGHGLAAECKGKSQSRCASDSSCTWVSGYTRNDGAKVKGYCRTKSRQSGQTSNKSKNKQYKEKQAKEKASKSGTSKDANSKDMKSKEKKAK